MNQLGSSAASELPSAQNIVNKSATRLPQLIAVESVMGTCHMKQCSEAEELPLLVRMWSLTVLKSRQQQQLGMQPICFYSPKAGDGWCAYVTHRTDSLIVATVTNLVFFFKGLPFKWLWMSNALAPQLLPRSHKQDKTSKSKITQKKSHGKLKL